MASKKSKHLDEQIERIIAEGAGKRREVIVQMGDLDDSERAFAAVASDALGRRSTLTTAREVLPPHLDFLKEKRSPKAKSERKRELKDTEQSMVSQLAAQAIAGVGRAVLRKSSLGYLAPLLTSDLVLSAAEPWRRPRRARWRSPALRISGHRRAPY